MKISKNIIGISIVFIVLLSGFQIINSLNVRADDFQRGLPGMFKHNTSWETNMIKNKHGYERHIISPEYNKELDVDYAYFNKDKKYTKKVGMYGVLVETMHKRINNNEYILHDYENPTTQMDWKYTITLHGKNMKAWIKGSLPGYKSGKYIGTLHKASKHEYYINHSYGK